MEARGQEWWRDTGPRMMACCQKLWWRGAKNDGDVGPRMMVARGQKLWWYGAKNDGDAGPRMVLARGQEWWWRGAKNYGGTGPIMVVTLGSRMMEARGQELWWHGANNYGGTGPGIMVAQIQEWWRGDNSLWVGPLMVRGRKLLHGGASMAQVLSYVGGALICKWGFNIWAWPLICGRGL